MKRPSPEPTSDAASRHVYELARLIALPGPEVPSWVALIPPEGHEEDLLQELRAELPHHVEGDILEIDVRDMGLDELVDRLRSAPSPVAIVRGFDRWEAQQLKALDVSRSALGVPRTIVLWLSQRDAERLYRHAPNLGSWLGGNVLHILPGGEILTEPERRERLAQLRNHYRMTDTEVVEKAERGKLPPEPEFVEWLILLDKGDLIRS